MESMISSYMDKYYYANREVIGVGLLSVMFLVFICAKIYLLIKQKDKTKSKATEKKTKKASRRRKWKGVFFQFIKELFQYLCVILCGHLFFYLDLFKEKNTEYVCFLGIAAEFLLILYFLARFCSKRPRSKSIQLGFQWTKYVCYVVVFLAKIQGSLDIDELHFGLAISVLCGVFSKYLIREKKTERDIPAETDYSIETKEQLFPRRKEQLETFIEEWEKQIEIVMGNPYVLLLNAPWGYGKTSFLNAFCDEIESTKSDKFELVYLEAGVDCDSTKLLEDFEKQLRDIFKNNAVLEDTDSIKKYVKNLSELVNGTDIGLIEKFGNLLFDQEDNSLLTDRENANKSMNTFHHHTKKNIVIIIDDIERSSKNRRNGIFNVLYECMHLNYCHTIFVADKSKMIDENTPVDYFDKYINEEVNLCDVDFKEIFEFYQDDLLGDTRTEDSTDSQWLAESRDWFEKNAVQYTNGRLYTFDHRIKEIRKKIQKEKYSIEIGPNSNGQIDVSGDIDKEVIALMQEEEQRLLYYNRIFSKNLQNPRCVKKYMRDGIRKSLYRTYENWFEKEDAQENSYSKLDWLNISNNVLVLKFFLPSLYQEIRKYSSLAQFETNDEQVYKVLEVLMKDIFEKEKEKALFEILIYHEYVLDPKLDRNEEDLMLDNLKKAKDNPSILRFVHLEPYLDLPAVSIRPDDYLSPILDCVIENKFINNQMMIKAAQMIMHYDAADERKNTWSKFRTILSYYATQENSESDQYMKLLSEVTDGIETIMKEGLEHNQEYLKMLYWDAFRVNIFQNGFDRYTSDIAGLYERLSGDIIDDSEEKPNTTADKALIVAEEIDNRLREFKDKYVQNEGGYHLVKEMFLSLSAFTSILRFWYSPSRDLEDLSKDMINENQEVHVSFGNGAILDSLLEDSTGNSLSRKENAAKTLFDFCSALLGLGQESNINAHAITMITKIYENLQKAENMKKPDHFDDMIPLYIAMYKNVLYEREMQDEPERVTDSEEQAETEDEALT